MSRISAMATFLTWTGITRQGPVIGNQAGDEGLVTRVVRRVEVEGKPSMFGVESGRRGADWKVRTEYQALHVLNKILLYFISKDTK